MAGVGVKERGANVERASVRRASFSWTRLVYAVLFVALVAAGLYLGYLAYTTIREFAAHTQFDSMPVIPAPLARQQPLPQQKPDVSEAPEQQVQVPRQSEIYPDIESRERVNILFLGIDQRPGEPTACRTDTMILVSINPKDMSASLLSIPRDLWVPIPGREEGKINTAHYWGEVEDYPGGGPALAKHTVRYNFGVPVHYYVRLNFTGFERIIDTIGGIDVDVPVAIDDFKYPNGSYGYEELHIEAGRHHFNGEMALKYARTRQGTGDGDFTRMQRQQQVILAVRDRILSLPNLPQLVFQGPQLIRDLGDSLETDIPPEMVFTLAKWGQQTERENIRMDRIDRRMTEDKKTADGQAVLIYDREKARPLVEALFNGPTPEATSVGTNHVEQLEAEGARIAVYNGTDVPGLAGRVSAFLRLQGLDVVETDNADHSGYEHTVISTVESKPFTLDWLTRWLNDMGVPEPDVQPESNTSVTDITITIGQDFPADRIN